jgi:hypothetical protein
VSAPAFQDARNVPLVLGLLVGCLAYMVCVVFSPPVLSYLPEVGRWSFSEPPDLIAMRYYGMPQWGMGGFLIGFLLARVPPIARVLAGQRGGRLLTLATVAVVTGSLAYLMVSQLAQWS